MSTLIGNLSKKKVYVNFIKNHFEDEPVVTGKSSKNIFKNKYLRGVVYILSCLCTTLFYYGWQDFQVILYNEKAFEWLCSAEDLALREEDKACNDSQNSRIQNLFTIATSTEFAFAAVAGFLTDRFGPLLTSFAGNLVYILSWFFLLVSGESFPVYWLAVLLMGASVNMIAFPCLELEEFFPTRRRFALSLIIAAQTGGSLTALVMNSILTDNPTWTFTGVAVGYLLLIVMPLFILSMLVHPVKRIVLMKESIKGYSVATSYNEELVDHDKLIDKDGTDLKPIDQNNDIEAAETKKTKEKSYSTYFFEVIQEVWQLNYMLFLVYFILNIISHGYYPTMVNKDFDRDVSTFQGIFYPTQMIWGAVIGFIVDYSGTLIVCEALCVAFILASVLAVVKSVAAQYISSILFIMANAYIYSVKYTFLSEYFPRSNFQTLVGIVGCLAGLLSLVNIGLEEVPEESTAILLSLAGVVAATVILLIILQVRLRRVVKKCPL